MTLYYRVKDVKPKGKFIIVYDSDKPFKEAFSVMEQGSNSKGLENYLKRILHLIPFIKIDGTLQIVENYRLLFFNQVIGRKMNTISDVMVAKDLNELKRLNDKFYKEFNKKKV